MPLTCNIDARGKRSRFILGVILTVAGLLVGGLWALRAADWRAWTLTGALLVSGGFVLFEAWAGWCAVRAMGFKTKL